MAFLDTKQWQFGRQNVFAVTVGAADLPTTNTSGVIQVGDQVVNLSGAIGQPASWVCTAQSASSVTWTAGATVGGGTAVRTSAVATTLLSTDRYLLLSAAATVTLPAPNTTLSTHAYDIKALLGDQPVTITAAGSNFDGVTLGSQTLEGNQAMTLFTDGTQWLTMGRDPMQQINKPASPYTLSATDKILIVGAGTYTLPVITNVSEGYEFVINATASSVTIAAAASTSISGAAAVTLTSNQNARILGDGTTYWRVGS